MKYVAKQKLLISRETFVMKRLEIIEQKSIMTFWNTHEIPKMLKTIDHISTKKWHIWNFRAILACLVFIELAEVDTYLSLVQLWILERSIKYCEYSRKTRIPQQLSQGQIFT